jgi:hypothetical protein
VSSALTAAATTPPISVPTQVIIYPGSYTESINIPQGINIFGYTDSVQITGNATFTPTVASLTTIANITLAGTLTMTPTANSALLDLINVNATTVTINGNTGISVPPLRSSRFVNCIFSTLFMKQFAADIFSANIASLTLTGGTFSGSSYVSMYGSHIDPSGTGTVLIDDGSALYAYGSSFGMIALTGTATGTVTILNSNFATPVTNAVFESCRLSSLIVGAPTGDVGPYNATINACSITSVGTTISAVMNGSSSIIGSLSCTGSTVNLSGSTIGTVTTNIVPSLLTLNGCSITTIIDNTPSPAGINALNSYIGSATGSGVLDVSSIIGVGSVSGPTGSTFISISPSFSDTDYSVTLTQLTSGNPGLYLIDKYVNGFVVSTSTSSASFDYVVTRTSSSIAF